MRQYLTLLALMFFLQNTSYAENSVLNKAMESYHAENFKQAATLLLIDYTELHNFSANEKLDAATIFLETSKIYREIYKSALQAQVTYLKTIIDNTKTDSSAYAPLYLASAYFQLGDYRKSQEIYTAIDLSNIADSTETLHYQVLTDLVKPRTSNLKKTTREKQGLRNKLAQSYVDIEKFGNPSPGKNNFSNAELENITRHNSLPALSRNHLIRILIDRNRLDLAATLVITLDSAQPAHIERSNETKEIKYYDLSVSNTLAIFYSRMSNFTQQNNRNTNIQHEDSQLKTAKTNNIVSLIKLAEKNRLDKNYSTSLQILFSIAKNYPVVRQIQDAVQGEYLFEQRSSGIPTVF